MNRRHSRLMMATDRLWDLHVDALERSRDFATVIRGLKERPAYRVYWPRSTDMAPVDDFGATAVTVGSIEDDWLDAHNEADDLRLHLDETWRRINTLEERCCSE